MRRPFVLASDACLVKPARILAGARDVLGSARPSGGKTLPRILAGARDALGRRERLMRRNVWLRGAHRRGAAGHRYVPTLMELIT